MVLQKKAFTLIELMIVIFIITIMSSVLIVKTTDMDASKEKLWVHQLKKRLQMAEHWAFAHQRVLKVEFQQQRYQFYQHSTTAGWQSLKKPKGFWHNKLPGDYRWLWRNSDHDLFIFPDGELTTGEVLLFKKDHAIKKIMILASGEIL